MFTNLPFLADLLQKNGLDFPGEYALDTCTVPQVQVYISARVVTSALSLRSPFSSADG